MPAKEVHVELLLSNRVLDKNGETVGRIEELHGKQSGQDFEVIEFMLGPDALLERITTWMPGSRLLKVLTGGKFGTRYRVPWDKIDISDPYHPRLLLRKSELKVEHD